MSVSRCIGVAKDTRFASEEQTGIRVIEEPRSEIRIKLKTKDYEELKERADRLEITPEELATTAVIYWRP